MADERWKYVVFNKSITEEESLDFYTTWAKDVSKPVSIQIGLIRCSLLSGINVALGTFGKNNKHIPKDF